MNVDQLKKLQYEEVAKCTRCGFCLPNCPTYSVRRTETFTPRGRNAITRAVIENDLELTADLTRSVFTCLGCGACTKACFPGINTKDAVLSDRACLSEIQALPEVFEKLAETLGHYRNISGDDNDRRDNWRQYLRNVPNEVLEKDKGEILYFVGCGASFSPESQQIPADLAGIMYHAGLDFTILGGDEWCCGFPLLTAGMPDKVIELKNHNLEKFKSIGAKRIVFSCPACMHIWKSLYGPYAELLHGSQVLSDLIKQDKLELKPLRLKVTYHDPCHLGRNSGVFEDPRQVIKSIPGVAFVELANTRNFSLCCGGGGNVEMVDPELSAAVARRKLEEIRSTGADTVVSSCPQCLRTISAAAQREGIELDVLDLTQLVSKALM